MSGTLWRTRYCCCCWRSKVDIMQYVCAIFIDNFSKHAPILNRSQCDCGVHTLFIFIQIIMIESEERKKRKLEISSITNSRMQTHTIVQAALHTLCVCVQNAQNQNGKTYERKRRRRRNEKMKNSKRRMSEKRRSSL